MGSGREIFIYWGFLTHPKINLHGVYTRRTITEKGDNCRMHRKSERRGKAARGRSTYQRLLTPPFIIVPSKISSYIILQHVTQVSELWDEYWNVSWGI